jgi:hypothetical protein
MRTGPEAKRNVTLEDDCAYQSCAASSTRSNSNASGIAQERPLRRRTRLGMPEQDPALRRLQRLARRLTDVETKASGLRDELYREMLAAREGGTTISAMSRALGVSRQRVQQILGRIDRRK